MQDTQPKEDILATLSNKISELNDNERANSKKLIWRIILTISFISSITLVYFWIFPGPDKIRGPIQKQGPIIDLPTSPVTDSLSGLQYKLAVVRDSVKITLSQVDFWKNRFDSLSIERTFKHEGFIVGNTIQLSEGENIFDVISSNINHSSRSKAYQLFRDIVITVKQIQSDRIVVFHIDDKLAGENYDVVAKLHTLYTKIASDHGFSIYVQEINFGSRTVRFNPRIKSDR